MTTESIRRIMAVVSIVSLLLMAYIDYITGYEEGKNSAVLGADGCSRHCPINEVAIGKNCCKELTLP